MLEAHHKSRVFASLAQSEETLWDSVFILDNFATPRFSLLRCWCCPRCQLSRLQFMIPYHQIEFQPHRVGHSIAREGRSDQAQLRQTRHYLEAEEIENLWSYCISTTISNPSMLYAHILPPSVGCCFILVTDARVPMKMSTFTHPKTISHES